MVKELVDQAGGLSSQNNELCSLLRNIMQVLFSSCIWNCTVGCLRGIIVLRPNMLTRSVRLLQSMMQIIDALSTCVRHVGTLEEAPDLDVIRSLPTCILKVLRETFQHCKVGLFMAFSSPKFLQKRNCWVCANPACRHQDSEEVYCGRLSLVADLLQGLFKEAYTLQKGLLELLDRISIDSSASEEQISDIVTGLCSCAPLLFPLLSILCCCSCAFDAEISLYVLLVIHSLLDICSIISNLDMALHANTWKFLIKSVQSEPVIVIH